MRPSRHDSRVDTVWRGAVNRWNRTPGYLKWIGGIVLGALVRYLVAHLFPESWERVERRLLAPTMPIWLAVGILIAVLALERVVPALYRRVRAAREGGVRLHPLFGVRWAAPPPWSACRAPIAPSAPPACALRCGRATPVPRCGPARRAAASSALPNSPTSQARPRVASVPRPDDVACGAGDEHRSLLPRYLAGHVAVVRRNYYMGGWKVVT